MKLQVDSYCWCSSEEVSIPVAWVKSGQTASCSRATCGPGCQQIDDPNHEEPESHRKVYQMAKFRPAAYDPARDSSSGVRPRNDSVTLIVIDGLCKCGCEEPVEGPILFKMGHDARLKGILIRAEVTGCAIRLVDPETGVQSVYDPLEYASEFSTPNCDWPTLVLNSARKYRPEVAARKAS